MNLTNRLLFIALFLTLVTGSTHAQECTTSWEAPVDGAWTDATRWTNGLPGTSSVVCITVAGDYTVTAGTSDFTVAGIIVGGEGGTPTLTNQNALTVTGDAHVHSGARWEILNRVPGGGDGVYLGGTLFVEGTLRQAEGTSFLTTGGVLDVAVGGRYEMHSGANAGGAASLFRILGTLEASNCAGGSGNCWMQSPIEVDGGTIRVVSGQLDIRRTGSLKDVTFDVAEGARLWISGNQTPSAERVFVVEGTISGDPAGDVDFTGVDLDAGEHEVTFDMGGTGMRFSGVNGRAAALTGTTGSFVNINVMELGGHLAVSSWGQGVRGVTLSNNGSLELTPSITLWDDGRIENAADATVRMRASTQISGEGTFENSGRLLRDVGGPTSFVNVPYHGRPGSTIEMLAGRIDFRVGGSLDGAAFVVAEGATLAMLGQGDARLWTLDGTLSGTIEGLLSWYGSDFAAGPSNPVLDFTGEGLQFSGQTGRPTQFTDGGGTLTNAGRITLAGSSGWGIGARGATVVNEGLIELIFPFLFWETGLLRNQPNGVVRMANAGFGVGDNDGIVENHGLIVRDGNETGVGFNSTLRSMPGSELRVLTGRLDLDPPGEHSFPDGTTVTGTNQVRLISGLTVGGTISPGTEEQPIVTQEFVTSLQMSQTTRTVIDIDADGESDTIIPASGSTSTTLDGTLVVRPAPGFTPSPGDEWVIFLRSANPYMIQGEFDAIEVEGDVPDGLGFVTVKPNAGVVVLRAVSGATIQALAESTVEGGAPVQFVISVANPVPPGSVVEIPLAFEGTATRYVDYVVDITGNVARIPAGQTQTTITLFPLADDHEDDDETVTIRILPGGDVAPGSPDAATIVIEDGPLTSGLSVGGISPVRGAAGASVTASIHGQGFGDGAVVRLVSGGTTILGVNATVNELGNGIAARFNLHAAPMGSYDVVVDYEGQSSTLPNAFQVEEHDGLLLWADISGTPNPRQFRWSTYTVTVGNAGNADVFDTMVLIRITGGTEYTVEGAEMLESDLPDAEDYIAIDVESATVIPVYLYRLNAGAAHAITVRIRPTTAVGTGAGVSYELYTPNPHASFTWSGDWDDFDADFANDIPVNWSVLFGAIPQALDLLLDDGRTHSPSSRRPTVGRHAPDRSEAADLRAGGDLGNGWKRPRWLQSMKDYKNSMPSDPSWTFRDRINVMAAYPGQAATSLFLSPEAAWVGLAIATAVGAPVGVALAAVRLGLAAATADMSPNYVSGWPEGVPICCLMPPDGEIRAGGSSTAGPGGGPDGGNGGGAGGKVGGAVDPNDKLGPAGYEDPRFIRPMSGTRYTIRYENLDTATFPAQEVIIIDDIDASVFDLSTFSLGPITLPDRVIEPPPGLKSFHTVLDLAPELPALLVINAALDEAAGRAVWTFVTLDPVTMDLPEDGMVGFLPPNVNQPEGEGAVAFNIEMLPDLPTNTDVANMAEIYFDLNEPIITPVWSNRIDRDAPSTAVQPLGDVSESPLTINVSGSDAGSGIYVYTLFVSENGGPFEAYAVSSEPTFEFEGELDVSYGFYSIGTDHVYNFEGPKTEAEATTTIGSISTEGGPDLPRELTLHSPYPNPTTRSATLSWGLPAAAEPDIRIYDVLGREVLRLLDGASRPAGWHETRLDGSLASGVYVVRLSAERDGRLETRTQRLVVVR